MNNDIENFTSQDDFQGRHNFLEDIRLKLSPEE